MNTSIHEKQIQFSEVCVTVTKTTTVLFLDLKTTFKTVGREILWGCLRLKVTPEELSSFLESLYMNSQSRVRANRGFLIWIHLQKWCSSELLAFNFAVEIITENFLLSLEKCGMDNYSDRELTDI